ncbi:hypothetical protein ACFORJ_09540 [Corynebacterium hansenii]|uniref:Septum formation-related domain-containing protein n=1 Tax=Corynebacterium hansenii TaxID=394964 RepID=A0ABV7ZT43_9CORY|nr:hypothetical protein [Corynebacterium hansenii]WJZ00993.1 hypothetical protein CHAN_12035 [Corynebacterium hansenii]
MSDHTIARQSTVIPAAAGHDGGRRRRVRAAVGAVAGVMVLVGGGFFAGVAAGQQSAGGDDRAAEVDYRSALFGSSLPGSLPGSSSSGPSSAGGDESAGAEDSAAPGEAGRGEAGPRESGQAAGDPGDAAGETTAAPDPGAARGSGGRTGFALRGDVIEIEGEDVLVCATGNGFGMSHIGVTLSEGADADATRAESDRLCADALRVMGALVLANRGEDLLGTERDVEAAGRTYRCRPVAEKVLRCTGDDGSVVTLWSAAP